MDKIFLGLTKKVEKTIKVPIELRDFKNVLNRHKPTGIVHPFYSLHMTCWEITEYIDDNSVMYYAQGWADKTPKPISIDDLYKELKRQGLEECYFHCKIH